MKLEQSDSDKGFCIEKRITVFGDNLGQNPYSDMNNSLMKVVHIEMEDIG